MKTLVHSQDRREGWPSPFKAWGNQTLGMVQSIQRLGACASVIYNTYRFGLYSSFCTELLKLLEFPNC